MAVDLYAADSAVGQRLFINRIPFDVVGVLTERGQGLDIANEDEEVYIPLTTAMRRLLNRDYFNALVFEIADWNEMDTSARVMGDVMRGKHRVAERQRPDFQIQNQKEPVDTQLASSARLGFFIRWIGVSGLIVSGIGVLAIAWMSVRDRTTEIGTRRALGATASDVFFQFGVEASVLALLGCVIGLWIANAGSALVAVRAHLPMVFDRSAAAGALGGRRRARRRGAHQSVVLGVDRRQSGEARSHSRARARVAPHSHVKAHSRPRRSRA